MTKGDISISIFTLLLQALLERTGKRKLLAGKFCDPDGKIKEIHNGNHPTLEGNFARLERNIFQA